MFAGLFLTAQAFATTQDVRITQINGVAPTVTAGALATSDNIAQINGVTPLMGNGATGTGALRVSLASDSTGVVQPGNTANTTPWLANPKFSMVNLAANATTTIKSGAGVLHSIVINTKGIGNTCTVYDNTAGSGTKLATMDTTLSTTAFTYDGVFTTGLTVVIAGGTAADMTFSYA